MNEIADTLIGLVNIRSVIGGEGRICTAIAERLLATWGMDSVNRVGNSLIVGQRTNRPLITLYGHIDTVPEQGQGDATISDDRLFGLGASDMKAGIAIMIHLLEDGAVRNGPYDVVGVFYDKEEGPSAENGLIEVLDRAAWLTDSEFAVVLEPTDLELQLGCQGVVNAEVVFEGVSAHSARPWLGENAVTKAGPWLERMHAIEPKTVMAGGLEFKETITVTSAEGGVARNIIPGRFTLNVNYRFPPGVTSSEAADRVRELCTGVDSIEIVDIASAAPVPEGNPHIDRLAGATGAEVTPKQAWTDVARLAELGVPAVNYGPGETAMAHQANESVPIANLLPAFQGLRRFLTT